MLLVHGYEDVFAITLFYSASKLKKLILTPSVLPELNSSCFSRNTKQPEKVLQSINRDRKSEMDRVDVNRYFSSSDHSSVTVDSAQRHVDDRTRATDGDLSTTSYIRLDVLRITLAVIDFFILLHRCACLGCCSCFGHSDGQMMMDNMPSSSEVMPNGVAGGGIVLCSKHDAMRRHKICRAPNGSVSRPTASDDVHDNTDVTDSLCPLHCRHCRQDVWSKAKLRRNTDSGSWRHRWTKERHRRRRQLASLLTKLVLCSIVVPLVYIVVRSLDVILAELITVATKQCSVVDLLVTETFPHQVQREIISY